jgi:hypothetical protein
MSVVFSSGVGAVNQGLKYGSATCLFEESKVWKRQI